MKENLVIFGCGGTGREIEQLVRHRYNVLGFLDDRRSDPDIIGQFHDYTLFDPEVLFCSSMSNYTSMACRMNFLKPIPLSRFITFLDDHAYIYPTVQWGAGVFVFPDSLLSHQAVLGDHVMICHNCVVAHDVVIEDYSVLANSVTISGGAHIGSNCYIGAGAIVLDNVTIGDNCVIAAGATVISSVERNQIYIAPHNIKNNHYLLA